VRVAAIFLQRKLELMTSQFTVHHSPVVKHVDGSRGDDFREVFGVHVMLQSSHLGSQVFSVKLDWEFLSMWPWILVSFKLLQLQVEACGGLTAKTPHPSHCCRPANSGSHHCSTIFLSARLEQSRPIPLRLLHLTTFELPS